MEAIPFKEIAESITNDLRLKTLPVAAKFLKSRRDFPEKARQPSVALGKRITICQAVTMARIHGWTVGLTREDLICVPAMIVFGFSDAADPPASLAELYCEITFSGSESLANQEARSMSRLEPGEFEALVLAPLARAAFEPDTAVFYGNPAQIMRFAQAWSYGRGERVSGHFGGKVECDECLIAPFKTRSPRVVIPGNGERIFAMTQDDEAAFALPGEFLAELVTGLKESGRAIGTRYPVPPYQNFQPEFPRAHREMGRKVGIP